ncbi:MAG: hypothetical protein ACR2OE_15375 [Thermomicrobiales bacterium]
MERESNDPKAIKGHRTPIGIELVWIHTSSGNDSLVYELHTQIRVQGNAVDTVAETDLRRSRFSVQCGKVGINPSRLQKWSQVFKEAGGDAISDNQSTSDDRIRRLMGPDRSKQGATWKRRGLSGKQDLHFALRLVEPLHGILERAKLLIVLPTPDLDAVRRGLWGFPLTTIPLHRSYRDPCEIRRTHSGNHHATR